MTDGQEPVEIDIWLFIAGVFGIGVLTGLGLSEVIEYVR